MLVSNEIKNYSPNSIQELTKIPVLAETTLEIFSKIQPTLPDNSILSDGKTSYQYVYSNNNSLFECRPIQWYLRSIEPLHVHLKRMQEKISQLHNTEDQIKRTSSAVFLHKTFSIIALTASLALPAAAITALALKILVGLSLVTIIATLGVTLPISIFYVVDAFSGPDQTPKSLRSQIKGMGQTAAKQNEAMREYFIEYHEKLRRAIARAIQDSEGGLGKPNEIKHPVIQCRKALEELEAAKTFYLEKTDLEIIPPAEVPPVGQPIVEVVTTTKTTVFPAHA